MPTTRPTPAGVTYIAPLVHLNGSSADHLIDGYLVAADALRKALEALAEVRPNGRDYYLQDSPNPMRVALTEHDARVSAVEHVILELSLLTDSVVEQRDARKR